jgi:hypothetical protein
MLRSRSNHLALPENRRDALLEAIGEPIDDIGSAEVSVTTRLWLATRI